MRIGVGTSTVDPSRTHGRIDGIGVYTKNLLNQYQQHNCQVVPIMYPPLGKMSIRPQLPNSLMFPFSYPVSALANLVPAFGNFLMTEFQKKISIFHATDYRIPRFKNIPVVATLHDAIMLKNPEWSSQTLRNVKNWMMKTSTQWAQHYITVSASMVPELVEYWGIEQNKIDIVHNGIDEHWFEPVSEIEKERVINKYKLPANYLLFVGTLQPRKNIDRVIKAFKQLPADVQREYKLVLVGRNGWRTEELLNEIKALNESKRLIWLQYVPFEDIHALYQCAKLLLFPSLYEGFGLPILEGFASKIPVITSNITSMPEVAGDAAYLVDPYDIDNIVVAINKLLFDSALCQTYIQKGAERVRLFTWKSCAEKTLAVYKKLLS